METFVIRGGRPLQGTIEVRGAKNAVFPVLAAAILTKKDCVIDNLPLIEDVFRMLEILESMGARIVWQEKRKILVNTAKLNPSLMKRKTVLRLRGSVLFLGPLLARFSKVSLPQPGGDIIGARPIDTHLDAFSQLGAQVHKGKARVNVALKRPSKGGEVVLSEFSVTGTCNTLLFAANLAAKVTLKIADQDYQIQELISVLKSMGAGIRVAGPHAFEIQGKKNLKGFHHTLSYDPIEAGTFIILAIGTKGNVLVKNVEVRFLDLFFKRLKEAGAKVKIVNKKNGLANVRVLPAKSIRIEKIQSFIYPGIASDLQNAFGVLATQAQGSTLLHDPLYESRLKYLEELNKMGAHIYISDPHRAIISGPTPLQGTDLGTFDIRGGAALLMAALIAKGRSTINNIYQIDRGCERIEERLCKLGADIKRINANFS
ncbi:MAG: UDP-N-acetylglucosamine 1-carboxyvinyltransferase [Candidatus Wildermuthbacteria bacterium RIFCSPLOWO2_02_FULL_47_9c]|uniref:UDP-N-acetylglucosamine 1-carboxyvinyltransferase n=1 Tax=Candidatus Wildermuthbacteria bacterium RIFCSPLOWO2_02_FULL_47_9c TaxID=1802466 RepID=A0A1G2RV81_9BACT|nr:MAG: UDP-N-acetylglucosamine 1-carboxyvinyltransferase [Candidatus Wildermuthbacteria bacterium RIFCSPLOWO2_02_FULL_47_9c]